jgi:DNA-binding IclR family transcriptional regulator
MVPSAQAMIDALMKTSGIRERAASNHLKKLKEEGLLSLDPETGKYSRSGDK